MRSRMRSLSKRRVSWGDVWMKILFINDFHQYSGAEKVVNSLVYWLKKFGHETLLVTHEEIHNLDKIIIKFKPDLINQHNFSLFGSVALKYSEKIPFVQTIHDYWIVCKTRHHYLYREDRICPYYNFANCDNCPNILGSLPMPQQSKKLFADIQLTTVSNYVKDVLVKFGFNPDNIHVIHNGIETKDLEPKDMNFVFCTAKNPAQIKGARFFAEVASRLPYKFMLSGTTSYSGVTNLGFLPEDKLFNMYKNCSIYVFPSVWEEPAGLTHLEAMQFGKPVVAFDAGGVKEYVKNCIIPLRDIDAMATKVKELMEDENLRKKLGEENRENVLNNFTAEIMAKKYLKLFEKLI